MPYSGTPDEQREKRRRYEARRVRRPVVESPEARERRLARERAYHAANRDRLNAQSAAYYQANRDRLLAQAREYRHTHKAQDSETNRRWRAANLGALKEAGRQYHAANRNRLNEANRQRYAANRERYWATWLWSHHGLRPEEWAAIRAAQGGRCYLCEEPLPEVTSRSSGIVIDHDHRCCGAERSCSRCRRGLAHNGCNQFIGLGRDDPDRMRRIVRNFARVQRQVNPRLTAAPDLFAPAPPRPRPEHNGNGHRPGADPAQWEAAPLW